VRRGRPASPGKRAIAAPAPRDERAPRLMRGSRPQRTRSSGDRDHENSKPGSRGCRPRSCPAVCGREPRKRRASRASSRPRGRSLLGRGRGRESSWIETRTRCAHAARARRRRAARAPAGVRRPRRRRGGAGPPGARAIAFGHLGVAKARWLALTRSPGELQAMVAIKRALDPAGMLKPGAVLA
jgi:hypothetical protein